MIRFEAQHYDGKSTRAHPVTVCWDGGDRLRIEGLAARLEVPVSAVEIASRLGATPRSLRMPDGASCETMDNDAVDALALAVRRGRASAWLHRLESRWRWALGVLALLVVLALLGVRVGIPWLAERAAMRLPPELAYDLGRGTLAALDAAVFSRSGLSEGRQAELRARFAGLAAEYPDLPLHLEFREAGMANAFALPDGTVVVTDELVELAKADEEVIAVLAHEIGHVHHRHTLRMALESSATALLALALLGDVSQVAAFAAVLPAMYAEARFSRLHETEADSFALTTLRRLQIPPRHFAAILQRLDEESSSEDPGVLAYLSSHPPTAERIARFDP